MFTRHPFKLSLAAVSIMAISSGIMANSQSVTTVEQRLLDSTAPGSAQFIPVQAPATDAEKRAVLASPMVALHSKKGNKAATTINFHTLMRTGDKLESNSLGDSAEVFGLLRDHKGEIVLDDNGQPALSNANEHTTLLDVHGKLFSIAQFESRPGAFYLMELAQDNQSGELSVLGMKHIDAADVRGGWVHCAASRTPWKSHLASEEYEPNARKLNPETGEINSYYEPMHRFFSSDKAAGLKELNPYDYGWNIELAVKGAQGEVEVDKHYAMGRVSIELSYVMPDEKTVYITDDGTNVGMFMFVADKAGDLSAGTLYAIKWKQTSAVGAGTADVEWISLGHASNEDIQTYLGGADYSGNKLSFNDIFDTAEMSAEGSCPTGFTSINTSAGAECLNVKPGMEKAASRLETRRYAAMMGATTEFRKEEGITFNPERGEIYVAMSEVARGMEDFKKNGKAKDTYDLGGNNDIKLDRYNKCGAVYAMDVTKGVNDKSGTVINSAYVASNMYSIVEGRPTTANGGSEPAYPADSEFANNKCHLDGIANPDNVTFMNGYNTLIIGEDTGSGHQNDVIWAFNLDSRSLTRIQTTPYGSETTSPYWYPMIDADGDGNGFAYLMSVVQHPYGESDKDKLKSENESRAYTGYLGPFPALK